MDSARRVRPLPVRVGDAEVLLLAAEANLVIDAIGRTVDGLRRYRRPLRGATVLTVEAQVAALESLREAFGTACASLVDPPLAIGGDQALLLRAALAGAPARATGGIAELDRLLRKG